MDSQHMTLKDWIITMIILCIPCVNIVMLFVWAFGSNTNPNKKTFCQASIIWALIWIVIYFVIIALFGASIAMLGSM